MSTFIIKIKFEDVKTVIIGEYNSPFYKFINSIAYSINQNHLVNVNGFLYIQIENNTEMYKIITNFIIDSEYSDLIEYKLALGQIMTYRTLKEYVENYL